MTRPTTPSPRPYLTPAQVRTMTPMSGSTQPEARMMRLELQHACAAIERASLVARDRELRELAPDFARLLEAARATLDLIKGNVSP